MMNAFVSALDAAVQDEFDVAAQVSDEEWEAIRPTKSQRRDMLLKHMQVPTFLGLSVCVGFYTRNRGVPRLCRQMTKIDFIFDKTILSCCSLSPYISFRTNHFYIL